MLLELSAIEKRFGGVHALNFAATPAEYYARADDELAIILQCEHIEAVRHFDHVYSVPGIDAVFVGPNDLAASMRDSSGKPPSAEVFRQTLADILAGCRRIGVPAGIHGGGSRRVEGPGAADGRRLQ